jgi:ubiquitin-activating enzyme E1
MVVDKLQAAKLFVVGAGAIGCEILKNLAAMGIGTVNGGKVVVTDMDTIEKSNLSRQLLFRDGDIGTFKSVAAREAVLRYCPMMQIEAHSCKVGEGSSNNPFDESFWSSDVDVVLNALDNVEARLHMDTQCVANKKALIDAGTMGPKGNVQVIVPNKSESYASSADPPEPSIPLCTIKNFPYAIAHTIQWGRDLFEGLFQRRPQQANDFLDSLRTKTSDDVVAQFIQDKGADNALEIAKELEEDLSMDILNECSDLQVQRKTALRWAIELALKLFYYEPIDLLRKHPLESVDDEGQPFWAGSRRPPKSLIFNLLSAESDQSNINENFVEFVRNGAKLRVETFNNEILHWVDVDFTSSEAHEACIQYFKINDKFHAKNEGYLSESTDGVIPVEETLRKIVSTERRMKTIEFEKDDELNGHVAFVNAASNLRAMVYGIPIVDAMETRRVAGKIVPAMISTTAFVSALSCTELVKVAQNADLKRHRNAFINLALPFFAFTLPLPAEKLPGLHGKYYTIWDQLSIYETKKSALAGGITMKSLLKRIKKVASNDPMKVNVVSISAGPYMLYANFLHDEDEELLPSSLWEQLKDAITSSDAFDEENSRGTDESEIELNVNDSYIDLTVVVEDVDTGEEIELPRLRVHRYQP